MSAPRHLWSGDWRLDSAAAAKELAKRRAQNEEPAKSPEPAPPVASPSGAARAAAAAGLERGDVLTSIENHLVTTPAQVKTTLARHHAGDRVDIQYVASFTTYNTQATLTKSPGSP